MNGRWMAGLVLLAGLVPVGAGAAAGPDDPVADRFSFPLGAVANNPTTSRYQAPDGRFYLGWSVRPGASFLSPGYGRELQPGEDWAGRGGGETAQGQPVYAAAAGTIIAAGDYGERWGHVLLIRHTLLGGQVVLTQYAFLADIVKSSGTVQWREPIGHLGRSGALHLELRRANMAEFPPDYWPTTDGKDADWVRSHYFSPTQFIRSHYRVLAPVLPGGNPPSTPGPGNGTGPAPGGPGTVTTPGTPDTGAPSPPVSAWDKVPHLDGSLLKSAAGVYYLLQSGKKWRVPGDEVLATWARPQEALPAADAELDSYPDGSHPLGLRAGILFKAPYDPICISNDPFDPQGLACWVIPDTTVFAAHAFDLNTVKPVSKEIAGLYIRPTPFDQNSPLPHGMLIRRPYGSYYIVDDMLSYLPTVHPVTSLPALHSWRIDETAAVAVGDTQFWDRILQLAPVRFRPGTILRSGAGQLYVVSGDYKYRVDSMATFHRRGYNEANAIAATDAELSLHNDWPTPLP